MVRNNSSWRVLACSAAGIVGIISAPILAAADTAQKESSYRVVFSGERSFRARPKTSVLGGRSVEFGPGSLFLQASDSRCCLSGVIDLEFGTIPLNHPATLVADGLNRATMDRNGSILVARGNGSITKAR